MKKFVVVLFCFFATNAFASSADSGKCPWKLPFTITVNGVGNTLNGESSRTPDPVRGGYVDDDTNYWTFNSNANFSIRVDTTYHPGIYASTTFSLSSDVLSYTFMVPLDSLPPSSYPIYQMNTLTITFAPGTDSIISMTGVAIDTSPSTQNFQYLQTSQIIDSFKILSLNFDDTSIFTTDSSFSEHTISFSERSFQDQYYGQNYYDYTNADFTASSVTLSGIFRPATFSDPPSIVTETPQPNNLAIYASNGSIACSFDVSDHARDLEIFSPLGIREASFTVSPGQTGASLPHLPAGFYFVRLGSSLAKMYIAN